MPDITEPIIANKFYFAIDGVNSGASLQEVSGLDDESDVTELQQVGKDGKLVVWKVQGANRLKPGKLTVKYAAYKGDKFRAWRDEIIQGKTARKNCTLTVYDIKGEKTEMEIDFTDVWPSKYSMSTFSAKGNDPVAITVTLEHTGMKIKGYNA